jgi:hypothetical protein
MCLYLGPKFFVFFLHIFTVGIRDHFPNNSVSLKYSVPVLTWFSHLVNKIPLQAVRFEFVHVIDS